MTLANGEVRRRWTNPERTARIKLLCRLGMVSKSLDHHDIETLCLLPPDLHCALPHDLASELSESGSISTAAISGTSDPRADLAVYRAWFNASVVPPVSSQAEAFGVWGAPRRLALDALLAVSDNARKEARLRMALARGTPPAAPDLWAAGPDELRAEGAPSDALLSRLVLRWRPGMNNGDEEETTAHHRAFSRPGRIRVSGIAQVVGPVSFFSLEFSGALGSRTQRENAFSEIARDPPTARDDSFSFQHVVSGLTPDTTYVFRLRAFNGVGPGPYVWRRFSTPPARPIAPVPVRVGARAVVLRWIVPDIVARRAVELRRSFDEVAASSVHVSRVEWLRVVAARYAPLLSFLRRVTTTRAAAKHLDGSGGAGHGGPVRPSLLDILESSDHDIIDWAWLRDCLSTATTCRDGEETTQFFADALTCAGGHVTAGAAADAAAARHVQRLASPTTYVLERCISELHGEWEEVLRTRFGEATINGLDAGAAHQFRVRAVNAAGAASPSGRATVINTLLNSPPPPRLARADVRAAANQHPRASASPHGDVGVGSFEGRFAVSSSTVTLVWLRTTSKLTGGHRLSGRGGGPSDRILAEWTGAAGEDEGAVSLTAVLARYSHGREDATFDGEVLPDVLTRLGAHRRHDVHDTVLRAAWDELRDTARDVVRTAHFAAWWNADVVTHILQRDQGVPAGRSGGGSSLETVTTYRGSGRGTEARLLRWTRCLPPYPTQQPIS